MTKKSRLKKLKIDELSNVDRGANQHADVVLMKRDTSEKPDLAESLVLLAKAYGGESSVDFREAVKEELEERRMREMWEKTWPLIDALRESIHAAAIKMSGDARSAQIELNVSNFKERLLSAINQKEQSDMNPDELEKRFEDMESEVATLKADKESLQSQLEVAKAEAGMSDIEKAHYASLEGDKKTEFAKMSTESRKQSMEKAVTTDNEITKRFEEELKKRDAQIEILQKRAEMAELSKRVETEYPNIPGAPADKALLLKSLESIEDEGIRNMGLGFLKSHNEELGKQMKEVGKSGGADTTASDSLEKMAASYASEHGVSISKAYDEVLRTPEGKRLYSESVSH